jgi:hypothetical protein
VVVAVINVQAETAVPAPHVLGAGRWEWMHCTIMSFGMLGRELETSLCVLIARRMEPERSGSSAQRPLGLSSRVAFCYLPICSCVVSSKEWLSDPGVPRRSPCRILNSRANATTL